MPLTQSVRRAPGHLLFIFAAALAFAGLSAACSSSPANAPADGGAVRADGGTLADGGPASDGGATADGGTIAERCRARAQLFCEAESTCAQSATFFSVYWANLAECVTKRTEGCVRFVSVPKPGEPATIPVLTEACTAAVARRAACDRLNVYVYATNLAPDPECAPVAGTRADGETCITNEQCQSKHCRYEAFCGTCAPLAAAGESCVTATDCAVGLTCAGDLCVAYVDAGGTCNADAPCKPGLTCVNGQCGTALTTGMSCDPRASNPCKDGYCYQGTCTAFGLDAQPGAPCGVDVVTGKATVCAYGSRCRLLTDAFQGQCVKTAKVGERCFFGPDDGFGGGQCETFSECVNGVCSSFPVQGCGTAGGPNPPRTDGGIQPPFDGGASYAALVQSFFSNICDAMFACPRLSAFVQYAIGTRVGCEAIIAPVFPRFTAPGAVTTPTALTACGDALGALPACERVERTFRFRPLPAACEHTGPLTPGSVCIADSQCTTSVCENGALSTACGVCIAQGGDGGVCAKDNDCARGLSCGAGRCLPGGARGATCSAAAPCDRELRCVNGTCGDSLALGATCNPRASGCADLDHCNSVTNQCESLRLVGEALPVDGGVAPDGGTLGPDGGIAGAPCGLLNGGLVYCPHGFNCRITNTRNRTGVCDVAKNPGEACTWTASIDGRGGCKWPSVCENDVCRVGDPTNCQ